MGSMLNTQHQSYNYALQLHYLLVKSNGMVKIIQNYTLHEQIGEGQYGKVYRGIDSRNKKQVAVKVINVKKFKQYPKLQQCTLNQIQVLSKISSPHIVKFIQILKTANNFYFFYEYCNQGTLQDVIKSKGTLTQSQTIQYLSQILQAFKILTSKHIMHRDLKPSNILVSDGLIKIADFGFCKSLQSHRDLAQTMLGSPIYMAPQVLKGQIYTIKADIWSLGVVVYQMLYGFCPFQQRSIARLINLLDKEEVTFNSQINRISPSIQQLLKKMLIKDHFKRIGWKQLFQYKINGVYILKSNTLNEQKQQRERQRQRQRPASSPGIQVYPLQQLKQAKNFQNISQRPGSRTSFDFNFQQYSGGKPPINQTTSLFKKQSQNVNKPATPAPSIQSSNPANKQNLVMMTQPVSANIKTKVLKYKIRHFLKVAAEVIQQNYCPQISINLCLKIYQTIQKQVSKLQDQIICTQQKLGLSQTIKLFQQQQQKSQKQPISGPLLNYYIKSLQTSFKDSFQASNPNKDMLIHCLYLLDLNQFAVRDKPNEYVGYGKEKLVTELYQKIIRNVI